MILLVVEFEAYLEALLGVVLVVTQSLLLERSLGRVKEGREKLYSNLFIAITSL